MNVFFFFFYYDLGEKNGPHRFSIWTQEEKEEMQRDILQIVTGPRLMTL